MNGQMKNYRDYIEQSYIPIDVNSLPYFFDMRGMREYAKKKGVPMTELIQKEKEKFLVPNTTVKKAAND